MNILNSLILRIMQEIGKHSLSLDLNDRALYLILDEALTNAMMHGNRWDPCRMVYVNIYLEGASLYIIITDEGEGFSQLSLSGGVEDISKKGIRTIRKFCNPYWNDKGNTIYLKLPVFNQNKPEEAGFSKNERLMKGNFMENC
jgi:hypothetical protein